MLELKGVNKYYTSNGVTNLGLRNINLKFEKNEIVAIVGESGSGKSTLLNVICKNDDFDEGEIYYKGNETSYFSVKDMDEFRKNKVSFVYQNYNIIDSYTVLENVMLPLILKGEDNETAKKKAYELIEKVGLKGKEKNRGSKLSGGEKQRCVIARALASDSKILACDEPTGNLDSKTSKEIIELIKEVSKDKLVLIVTHNYEDFEHFVTRKIRMSDGEVVEDVKFANGESEKEEDLDLDYVPLPLKVCSKIAKNNVAFTPRKSTFLFSVFVIVFMVALFLLQLMTIEMSSSYYGNNNYNADIADRFYLYDNKRESIDNIDELINNKDVDKVVINPFVEDQIAYLKWESDDGYFQMGGCIVSHVDNVKYYKEVDVEGIEIITSTKDSFLESCLNKDVVLDYLGKYKTKVAKLGYSTSIKNGLIIKLPEAVFEKFNIASHKFTIKLGKEEFNTSMFQNGYLEDLGILQNNPMEDIPVFGYKISDIDKFTKPLVVIPNEYKGESIDVTLAGLYKIEDYDIEYADVNRVAVLHGKECEFPVFEASVYTKKAKVVEKFAEKENIAFDEVSKIVTKIETIEDVFETISSYLKIIVVAFVLVFLSFISYFILQRIYKSKKDEYQILRTLGVCASDMSKIVIIEVFFVGVVAITSALIISFTILNTVPALIPYSKIDFVTIISYLIMCLVFTYVIANKFNHKLFKFTITKSLKEE